MSVRVVGLPSLPVWERSIALKVKVSTKTGTFLPVDLIRGPDAAPQAKLDELVLETAGAAGESDGKATSESVSKKLEAWALCFTRVSGPNDGKGSGAPSSSCLFCRNACQRCDKH